MFDLKKWVYDHNVPVKGEPREEGEKLIFDLPCCPFDSSHTGKDAIIYQNIKTGQMNFNCFHNSCSGKHWKDFRLLYEPDAYDNRKSSSKNEKKNDHFEWSYPMPLQKIPIPPFPVEALPSKVRGFVEAVAKTLNVPEAMPGTAALGVLAACMEGSYKVDVMKFDTVIALYALIVNTPGTKKSPVYNYFVNPVKKYQMEYNRAHSQEISESIAKKEALTQARNAAVKAYSKGKISEEEMKKVVSDLVNFEGIAPLTITCEDVTPESLGALMTRTDGKIFIGSSDGGLFSTLSGKSYSENPNIDIFLKGYDGDPYEVKRISREPVNIDHAYISMLIGMQPGLFSKIIKNPIMCERGLVARFIFTLPEKKAPVDFFENLKVPEEEQVLYSILINDLLNDYVGATTNEMRTITLDDEAVGEFAVFYDGLHKDKYLKKYSPLFEDWLEKYPATVARICGILCRSEKTGLKIATGEEKLIVDRDMMIRAIKIGEYYRATAKAGFVLEGLDPLQGQCEYVLTRIKENKKTSFRRAEAYHFARGQGVAQKDVMVEILDRLCDYGYLRAVGEERTNGRTRSTGYEVNPIFLDGGK